MMEGRSRFLLVACLAVVGIAALGYWRILNYQPGAAPTTWGISNAKQLATAMNVYSEDYSFVLPRPPDPDTLKVLLDGYIGSKGCWRTMNPNSDEFKLNPALGGVDTNGLADSHAVVLFYDPARWVKGKRIAARADAATSFVTPQEWDAIEPTLHLSLPQTPFLPSVRHGYKPRSKSDER